MRRFNKDELIELKDFRERVIYLFHKTWCQSRRKFCETHDLGKTTFYEIWNGGKDDYTDYIIKEYARAFNVSFDFMKYGGNDAGYYFERYDGNSRVCEEGPSYSVDGKKQKRMMSPLLS